MSGHETELLGAYVLGVLDGEEWESVRRHLDGCPYCRLEVEDLRTMEAALGEIPPEAFLEGPPPDGDLLLQKAIDQVRGEHRGRQRRRSTRLAVAAVVIAVVALGGGLLAGRLTGPDTGAAPVAAVARTAAATDPGTGATLSVAVQPAAGWVRLRATVGGVPAGEECRLYAVARDGSRWQAGSWVAEAGGTTLDGTALIAPDQIASVQAETYAGLVLVSATI
jgi:anti-sigma factor RsiW